GGASTADVGAAGPALEALAAAAVTVVAGECDGALAGPRIHVRGGTEETWDAFVAAAEEAGLDVVPLEQPADTEVRLLVQGSEASAPADVAIALDAPTLLAGSPAPALLAGYGRTPETMTALARVLAGEASAPGRLPVAVGDLPDSACCRRSRAAGGGRPSPAAAAAGDEPPGGGGEQEAEHGCDREGPRPARDLPPEAVLRGLGDHAQPEEAAGRGAAAGGEQRVGHAGRVGHQREQRDGQHRAGAEHPERPRRAAPRLGVQVGPGEGARLAQVLDRPRHADVLRGVGEVGAQLAQHLAPPPPGHRVEPELDVLEVAPAA